MVKEFVLAAIEGTVDSLTRQRILFFFGLRWHYGGLCDGDTLALRAVIPNVGLENIRFSSVMRSIFNDRLQNTRLIGQSVRCNWRGPTKL